LLLFERKRSKNEILRRLQNDDVDFCKQSPYFLDFSTNIKLLNIGKFRFVA
jgi:hypothetical protein